MVSMATYAAIGAALGGAIVIAQERSLGLDPPAPGHPAAAAAYVAGKLVVSYVVTVPAIAAVLLAGLAVNHVDAAGGQLGAAARDLAIGVAPVRGARAAHRLPVRREQRPGRDDDLLLQPVDPRRTVGADLVVPRDTGYHRSRAAVVPPCRPGPRRPRLGNRRTWRTSRILAAYAIVDRRPRRLAVPDRRSSAPVAEPRRSHAMTDVRIPHPGRRSAVVRPANDPARGCRPGGSPGSCSSPTRSLGSWPRRCRCRHDRAGPGDDRDLRRPDVRPRPPAARMTRAVRTPILAVLDVGADRSLAAAIVLRAPDEGWVVLFYYAATAASLLLPERRALALIGFAGVAAAVSAWPYRRPATAVVQGALRVDHRRHGLRDVAAAADEPQALRRPAGARRPWPSPRSATGSRATCTTSLGHSLSLIAIKSELAGRLLPGILTALVPRSPMSSASPANRSPRVRETVRGHRQPTLDRSWRTPGRPRRGRDRADDRPRGRPAARIGGRRAGLGTPRGGDQRRPPQRRRARRHPHDAATATAGRRSRCSTTGPVPEPRRPRTRMRAARVCAGCANGWSGRAAARGRTVAAGGYRVLASVPIGAAS